MPGKGKLTLTGQLGDVMKESAQAALTYCRSRSEELGVDGGLFRKDRHPYPCPGRGHPQGRSFRRDHHGHRPLLGHYRQDA